MGFNMRKAYGLSYPVGSKSYFFFQIILFTDLIIFKSWFDKIRFNHRKTKLYIVKE